MGIDWKREGGQIWRFEFIHSLNKSLLRVYYVLHPALDAGRKKKKQNTLSYTLSYNEDSSLAGKIISSSSFGRSISNLYWKNNLERRRTYMQVSPFSPDCTRLDHSLWIKFQVKPGSRKLTCKDLVTLKLL